MDVAGPVKLINDNEGVVSVLIFIVTLLLGWVSGIFSALRRKPKFELSLLDGPTFSCTFPIGGKHGEFDAHRTAFALYLRIFNIGSAPSSIANISIGFHWNLKPFSRLWLKYTLGWCWIHDQTATLTDFQAAIGDHLKVYPFLIQKGYLSPTSADTFLEPGKAANGVVYFEGPECYGGAFPLPVNGRVKVKVKVRDVFGGTHSHVFRVRAVNLEEARKYNPHFGKTRSALHGEVLPHDLPLPQ